MKNKNTNYCAAETFAFQDLQEDVTAVAKQTLEDLIDARAAAFRRDMEMKRTNLDQRVRCLNERAFALVENKVRTRRSLAGTPLD